MLAAGQKNSPVSQIWHTSISRDCTVKKERPNRNWNKKHASRSAHSTIFAQSGMKKKRYQCIFYPSYHNFNAARTPNYTPNASCSKLTKNSLKQF